MTGNQHPWLRDGEAVSKSEARTYTPVTLGSVEQLRALDGSSFWLVFILELDAQFVRKPSDTTTPDDGETTIRDANGQAWKIVQTQGGVEIHAAGLAEDRDEFDDEAPPFAYYATDEELLYVKNSATSADWSDGFAIKGPPGNDSTVPGPAGNDGADGTDPGILLNWDDGTTDADPGAGNIRADNADLSSATTLYISKTGRGGSDISAFLARLDDSTNPVKGTLTLTASASEIQATFDTGAVTDASGYVKLAVSGHSGETAFADAAVISFQFSRAGNKGADGSGTGDVTSDTATSVDGEIALFKGTSGKEIKRASTTGILKATSGVIGAATSGTDYAPATSGSSILKGSGSGGFSNASAGTDYIAPGAASIVEGDIANDAVTNSKLRNSAAVSVIGRSANSTGDPADIAADANGKLLGRLSDALGFATLSDFIDAIGSTRGSILYRGSSGWAVLTPGTSGHVLTSNGSGADPSYQAGGGGSFQPIPSSNATIDVGSVVAAFNNSGGTVNSGSTTAGSGLRTMFDTGFSFVSGSTLPGTWKNIGNANCNTSVMGLWVRTA